jgi:hypothetical protein
MLWLRLDPENIPWTAGLLVKLYLFLWESAAADRDVIVAGSHSHKGKTSLPIGRRSAP